MSELRRLRLNKGLSVDELAAQAGVDAGGLRKIEAGRTRRPQAGTLVKLADVLEVEAGELDRLLSGSEAA